MKGDAVFSECKTYRYVLTREWGGLFADKGPLVFIMLNPSTADESKNDPTVARCIRYAQRWGHSGLVVLNLFGLRSTDPAGLLVVKDPVGPGNDHYTREVCRQAETVVAAWGAHDLAWERSQRVLTFLRGAPLCLGLTESGAPRHPLYVRADVKPQVYSGWPK